MARVLLINPPKLVPLLDYTMRYPPLGLMSVAAVLDGHEVEILDLKIDRLKRKDLVHRMSAVDIVGISVLTPSIDSALELCRLAKECGALTVLGGPHASLMPQVAGNPEVDIVVRGEGEYPFREIADGRPWESIVGISYWGPSGVVHNPDRAPAVLNQLPPPRRDLVSRYKDSYVAFGKSMDAISTARGCPHRCSFCCVPKLWPDYRELEPGEVIQEIRRTGGAEIISIVDDNFCHDMDKVEAICDLIVQEGLDDRIYSVFSRVDSIVRHPEVVAKMARANMRVVFIGIEAATQAALDRMNKKTRIEDIRRACEILDSNGILIWAGHIVGNLDDTYEDVEALIKMCRDLPLDLADFTVITPYPGTDLFRQASERGLIDEYDFAEYCECEPQMHTDNLSRMEIMELQLKAYMKFYGLFAMLGRVRRWSTHPQKVWIAEGNTSGFWAFWKFRNTSARYFWRAYRQTVGKTEGTKVRKHSPLVSTPKLYSLGAGIAAAAAALFLTVLVGHLYGQYSTYPSAFLAADLLLGSVFVAFVVAAVASWLAIRSYRRGWIFSVRRRRPPGRVRSVAQASIVNGLALGASALLLVVLLIVGIAAGGLFSDLTYGMKAILITVIAGFSALVASYSSIQAVRNGGIERAERP